MKNVITKNILDLGLHVGKTNNIILCFNYINNKL